MKGDKESNMYWLISVIGIIIRNFVLPNPLSPLGDYIEVTYNFMSMQIPINIPTAMVYYSIGGTINFIAYFIVGRIYTKNSHPALGSALYTVIYAMNVFVIYFMAKLNFAIWFIIVSIVLYIILISFIVKVTRKITLVMRGIN